MYSWFVFTLQPYTFQYSHRYSLVEVTALLSWRVRVKATPKTRRKQSQGANKYAFHIIAGIAALALGTALASAPAFAQSRSAPGYSNTGPNGAPLSPNGLAAAASSFGGPGPGYIGPQGARATPAGYSNSGPYNGAPFRRMALPLLPIRLADRAGLHRTGRRPGRASSLFKHGEVRRSAVPQRNWRCCQCVRRTGLQRELSS